jgi:hypothetical protein
LPRTRRRRSRKHGRAGSASHFRFLLLYYVFLAFPGPLGSLASTVAGVFGVEIDESADPPWSWLTHGWQGVTNWMDAHGLAPYEVIHQRTGSGDTGHDFARVLASSRWRCWRRRSGRCGARRRATRVSAAGCT